MGNGFMGREEKDKEKKKRNQGELTGVILNLICCIILNMKADSWTVHSVLILSNSPSNMTDIRLLIFALELRNRTASGLDADHLGQSIK